jgi:hypothetical protein
VLVCLAQGVNTSAFPGALCSLLEGKVQPCKPLPTLLFAALLEDRLGHGVRDCSTYYAMLLCTAAEHSTCQQLCQA